DVSLARAGATASMAPSAKTNFIPSSQARHQWHASWPRQILEPLALERSFQVDVMVARKEQHHGQNVSSLVFQRLPDRGGISALEPTTTAGPEIFRRQFP